MLQHFQWSLLSVGCGLKVLLLTFSCGCPLHSGYMSAFSVARPEHMAVGLCSSDACSLSAHLCVYTCACAFSLDYFQQCYRT